ncbi:MAG: hypothetical protein HY644_10305 [Acidobacteria bacterium]|nr:hypothetical protein [Acidobacteriota bacterium]
MAKIKKTMKKRAPPIKPWPNCTFALKTKWEDTGRHKHFWVHLERRSPRRYGRLELIHAIVPKRKPREALDKLFASARYRGYVLEKAAEIMEHAGVPENQAHEFFIIIEKEYPAPTRVELFLGELEQPIIKLALGDHRSKLSYFKTGVPELTPQDARLIKSCINRLFSSPQGSGRRTAALLQLLTSGGLT